MLLTARGPPMLFQYSIERAFGSQRRKAAEAKKEGVRATIREMQVDEVNPWYPRSTLGKFPAGVNITALRLRSTFEVFFFFSNSRVHLFSSYFFPLQSPPSG